MKILFEVLGLEQIRILGMEDMRWKDELEYLDIDNDKRIRKYKGKNKLY